MPISFTSPWHLLLLLLIPVVVYFGRRSLAGLDVTRRRLALTVRSLAIALLALALAEVQWRDDADELEVAFVLDRSRSVSDALKDDALAAVNAARKHMTGADRARVIAFGRDAYTEGEISPDSTPLQRVQVVVGVDQTNIAKGLDTALNAFEKDAKKRIVLFSDGNETSGEALRHALLARERGAVVDVVPLRYKLDKEVFVEKVVLPSEVKVGEPYVVRVVVRSLAKTEAILELYEGGEIVDSRELALEPGVQVETFVRVLEKTGFFNVRALLRTKAASEDAVYQNNQAFGFVFARGESRVLYVHSDQNEGTEPLREALSLERINFDAAPSARVPKDEALLQLYDAIILDNVAKYELTLQQQQAIERAVKNQGLGLVMIGGPESFGAGGWEDEPPERTPIERALPVLMEPKQKTIVTNGALAIIMHSCEFPQGNDWGRKVTMTAIDLLSAKDYIGVVFYGLAGSEWRFKMQKALNKPQLKQLVQGMEPGDMPDFDASMKMAINGLIQAPATTKHMIILSDGDPSAPAPGLLKTCRDNKITISTIAIQPHGGPRGSEVALMKRIANATGGKFYYLTGPQQLPKIFIKETKRVARPLIRNIEFSPRIAAESPVIKGLESFPPLLGHVLANPKPRATVVLDTPETEAQPILVHWRYGVGKTVAFTSDASPRWAQNWIPWEGYSTFWGQLIRWVGKDVQDANFQVSTKVEGDSGHIVVDAINEDGDFIDKLNMAGTVTTPDGKEVKVSLRQIAPGRYEGDFPVGEVGTYTLSVLSKGEDDSRNAFTTGLVFPYSEEYKTTSSADALMEELAEVSKGRVLELEAALKEDVGFFNHELQGHVSLSPQWERLLQVLLVLFVIDVFIRRVMLDYGKIGAWLRRKPAAVEAGTPSATLARLKARKEQMRDDGGGFKKFDAPEGYQGDASELVAGGRAGPGAGGASSRPSAAPPPSAPQAEEGGDSMSRLLRAKRRAHDKDKGAEGEG